MRLLSFLLQALIRRFSNVATDLQRLKLTEAKLEVSIIKYGHNQAESKVDIVGVGYEKNKR